MLGRVSNGMLNAAFSQALCGLIDTAGIGPELCLWNGAGIYLWI